MLPWAGRFYWVGEGAKPGCAPNPEIGEGCENLKLEVSQDINLYSSDDLSSWVFEGVLVSQVTPLALKLGLHACLQSTKSSARLAP